MHQYHYSVKDKQSCTEHAFRNHPDFPSWGRWVIWNNWSATPVYSMHSREKARSHAADMRAGIRQATRDQKVVA